MFINKDHTANGMQSLIHRIERVEFKKIAYVTVGSYPTAEAEMAVMMDTFEMPLSALNGDDVTTAVYNWLVSSTGPFAGGKVVAGYEELTLAQKTVGAAINEARDRYINGGAITIEGRVDTDDVAIRNILGTCQIASMAMMTNAPFAITWKFADNTTKELTAPKIMVMGKQVMQHVSSCYAASWAMKDAVDTAVSADVVNAIDIVGPWLAISSIPGYVAPVVVPAPAPAPAPTPTTPSTDAPVVEPTTPEGNEGGDTTPA